MDFFKKIKHYDNMHIVFWLIKDSCWMLELKWLGIIMAVPTLTIAAYIIYFTRKVNDVYINAAIFFWICANSFWMFTEFFGYHEYKLMASYPFALGFIFVGIFYYRARFVDSISS